jgi:hypothetical protein
MSRLNKARALLALGMIAPVSSFAASHYCIAVNGGFGHGGTTFIGSGFAVPAAGTCSPWAGFTKGFSSVIFTSSGAGCLSSDGKVLTVSVASVDPAFLPGQVENDYVRVCVAGVKSCPIGGGTDTGAFQGAAEPVSCTSSLLQLPVFHD